MKNIILSIVILVYFPVYTATSASNKQGLANFLNSRLTQKLPFLVNNKSIQLKGAVLLTLKNRTTLQLAKLKYFDKKTKQYLVVSLRLKDNYVTALVAQIQNEESYAWLVNYTKGEKFLDALQVYYSNSEGNVWADTVVQEKNILVKSGNVYTKEGQSVVTIYVINAEGKFIKKAKGMSVTLKNIN